MGNLHRIQWIDRHIRAGRYPNCNAIAENFEISKRQAARDIEYLRDSLGAPLAFSSEHNGYTYQDASFRLPGQTLSEEAVVALRYLSEQYLHSSNQSAIRLADLFRSLSERNEKQPNEGKGGFPFQLQDAAPLPPVPDLDSRVYELYCRIEEAWKIRKKVSIVYLDAKNRESQRVIHPYLLYHYGRTAYVVGYCELRQEIRLFQLARIVRLEILRQGYIIPESFDPSGYLTESPVPSVAPYRARIRFPGDARLALYPFPHEILPDGVISLEFQRSSDFLTWLLAHPPGFRILEPVWLKERLRERLKKMMEDLTLSEPTEKKDQV